MWWTSNAINRLRRAFIVPQCFSVIARKKIMPNKLTYSVVAAPASDADVVERILTATVNGESAEKAYPASTSKFDDLTVTQGDLVILTLVDVDDAGNRSGPASLSFEAEDTIPPADPSGLGVTLVSEA
jgi:hypothetical protein